MFHLLIIPLIYLLVGTNYFEESPLFIDVLILKLLIFYFSFEQDKVKAWQESNGIMGMKYEHF